MDQQVYRNRSHPGRALLLAAALSGVLAASPPETIMGKHVHLTLHATPEVAEPSGHVTISIDVSLKPGLHVYAPGVEDYIPIAWTMKASPGVTIQPVTFPPSRKLHLPAIGETVPAYEGNIHLSRGVVLPSKARGDVTIVGSFRYQACDDRLCYIPETLPVKWVIPVKPK